MGEWLEVGRYADTISIPQILAWESRKIGMTGPLHKATFLTFKPPGTSFASSSRFPEVHANFKTTPSSSLLEAQSAILSAKMTPTALIRIPCGDKDGCVLIHVSSTGS